MAIPAYTVNCLLKLTIYCSNRKRASNISLSNNSNFWFLNCHQSISCFLFSPDVRHLEADPYCPSQAAGRRLGENQECLSFLVARCGGSGPQLAETDTPPSDFVQPGAGPSAPLVPLHSEAGQHPQVAQPPGYLQVTRQLTTLPYGSIVPSQFSVSHNSLLFRHSRSWIEWRIRLLGSSFCAFAPDDLASRDAELPAPPFHEIKFGI